MFLVVSLNKFSLFVYFLHFDLSSVGCVYKWLWLTSLSLTTKHRYRSTNIFIKISRTFIESVSQDDCQSENVSCQRWEKCSGGSCWWQAMFTNVKKHPKQDPPGRSSYILVYLWYKICSRALKRGQFWYSPFNFAVRLLSFVNILLWVGGMTRLWSFFMAWAAVDRSGPGSGGRFCRWGQNWFCPLPQGRRSPFWVGERSTHGESFLNKIKCFWLRQNENLRLRNKKTEPKGLAEN